MRRGAALCLLALSCSHPGVESAALPDAPIAFVYRNVEETERVLDESDTKPTGGPEQDELDIKFDELEKLAGRRSAEDAAHDRQGRVGLFVASESRLELPPSLARGARPLAWSPDRSRLMFSYARNDRMQLFEWLAASGEVRPLTSSDEEAFDGCYGPAGAIAWVQREKRGSPNTRVWIRRPGQPARAVSDGPSDLQPAWSPDGSRLVFTRVERGVPSLHWIDPESGAGGGYGLGRAAAFSPDGEWIAYSARTATGWQLRRMRADGSGKRSLGASGYQENDPSFSPDGRFVVFSAVKKLGSPLSHLFVRSVDGAHDRQLEFAGSGMWPVW